MSAKDIFHEVVKKALQKDGWQITHDQLPISVGGVNVSIDLAAEKLIAAEPEGEKLLLKLKLFWRNHLQSQNLIQHWDSLLTIEAH